MGTEHRPDWFFDDRGVPRGPHAGEDLQAFHREGRIQADTLVWCPRHADWLPFAATPLAPRGIAVPPPPMPIAGRAPSAVQAAHFESQSPAAVMFLSLLTLGVYGLIALFYSARQQSKAIAKGLAFEPTFFVAALFLVLGQTVGDSLVLSGFEDRAQSRHLVFHLLTSGFSLASLGVMLRNRRHLIMEQRLDVRLSSELTHVGLWASSCALYGVAITSLMDDAWDRPSERSAFLISVAVLLGLIEAWRWFRDHHRIGRALRARAGSL